MTCTKDGMLLCVQKLQINFKNIKIGPSTLTMTEMDDAAETHVRKFRLGPCAATEKHGVELSVRKIYIECENDLTEEQKEEIVKLKIGTVDTLKVSCMAETQEYKKGKFKFNKPAAFNVTSKIDYIFLTQ